MKITHGTMTFRSEGSGYTLAELADVAEKAKGHGIPATAEITSLSLYSRFGADPHAELYVNWRVTP